MQKFVNTAEFTHMNDLMKYYSEKLREGTIRKAYQGLMNFIQDLRNEMIHKYEDEYIIGNIYRGYMDMTYFPIVPKRIKPLKVKFGLYFIHQEMVFGISLSGQNKQIQRKYWEMFKESDFDKYLIPDDIEDSFIIIHEILAKNPDFSDLFQLSMQIEQKAIEFIEDITEILDMK